jgi:hypothetical protein
MNGSRERFAVLTRDEEGVLVPPSRVKEYYEQVGGDPRIPKKAIGRLASTHYKESVEHEWQQSNVDWALSLGWADEIESAYRPSHYPSTWGLSRIPRADELPWQSWDVDFTRTWCYTSLNIPRPFDPHVNGLTSSNSVGFGYMYRLGSSWMDRFDIIGRRGGGNRGGFAMTTGPTEGSYPSSILPSPTFDLGKLGYSDGGWQPEGMQYTNRPRRMRLTGLRNGHAHRVYFARSRQVMHRNLYGPISTTNANPRAPMVMVNGLHSMRGIIGISCNKKLNAPTEVRIEVSNPRGIRSGIYEQYDTVQISISPQFSERPPLIFTGFISSIRESETITITCLDALGYLSLEPLLNNVIGDKVDAAQVIRTIVSGSSYPLSLSRMVSQSRVTMPPNIDLTNKSRLESVLTVLDYINNSPRKLNIAADAHGNISLTTLSDPDDVAGPLIGGRSDLPLNGATNLSKTRDFWVSRASLAQGTDDTFNVATVRNENLNVSSTYPSPTSADYPSNPIHRVFDEPSASTGEVAEFFAQQYVKMQSLGDRYVVVGKPERFDIDAGDVMEFFVFDGAPMVGKKRIFAITWEWTPNINRMELVVGRPAPSLIGSLRFALNQ